MVAYHFVLIEQKCTSANLIHAFQAYSFVHVVSVPKWIFRLIKSLVQN